MELTSKLVMSLALIWVLWEIRQVRILIDSTRLTNFLNNVTNAIWFYIVLRIISAILESTLGFATGYFSIISSGIFFVIVSLTIRFRRQRLAAEWNNAPPNGTHIYNEGIQTLQTVTKELTKIT